MSKVLFSRMTPKIALLLFTGISLTLILAGLYRNNLGKIRMENVNILTCKANLTAIFLALLQYNARENSYPDNLFQLVKNKYLNKSQIYCPAQIHHDCNAKGNDSGGKYLSNYFYFKPKHDLIAAPPQLICADCYPHNKRGKKCTIYVLYNTGIQEYDIDSVDVYNFITRLQAAENIPHTMIWSAGWGTDIPSTPNSNRKKKK
ncbi:hypothetical protein SDC9_81034 [bioreactor metagenome]|uniref:Uncharacterized protein n=1 Tax=bioreactor metagenome TaxID=1076179 RepID=A0A644Z371_9ZZZZ